MYGFIAIKIATLTFSFNEMKHTNSTETSFAYDKGPEVREMVVRINPR